MRFVHVFGAFARLQNVRINGVIHCRHVVINELQLAKGHNCVSP